MGPLNAKSTVATKSRYGKSLTKVDCDVLNKSSAPITPPIRLVPLSKRTMDRLCLASSLRYAHMLATDPGQRATVLVALALIGRTPVNMSEGSVIKLPPPATELSVPPSIAAIKRMHPCSNVMREKNYLKSLAKRKNRVLTTTYTCSNIHRVKRTA